jgi:hypothetical protein
MCRRDLRAQWTRALSASLLVLTATAPVVAGAQQIDSMYTRLIREYTTDPRFLPSSASTIPYSATVPNPQRHFGTIAGAPGIMHHADEVYGYFRALAKASPRVRVEKIGTTEEGREITLVAVADEASLTRLDDYRQRLARLADPRAIRPNELEALIGGAKPVYYLNGGLHSPEMGSPEMLMELAFRLAVSDEPVIKKIRENVVTIINPVSEPDGRDRQVDWYLHFTKGRPNFEDGYPRSSPYWGKYVVHDNNRDGIQISQALTKAIYDTYYRWHPLVMHDLHESVPLLYVSTGTGPYNETNDPIAISEWQLLANNDVTRMSAQGLPGVWTWGFFDGWWPGYAMWVANNHNAIGRFYETFGNAGADTYERDLSRDRYSGEAVTTRTWYRVWPPTSKVRWSARDNVNYMEAGVLSSLEYTADNARMLLQNFYQKGMNSIARGREQKPHAYVIPGFDRQRDPKRTAYLVNQLRRHGIEVNRVTAGDSAGDYVVLLNQPYRDLAVNLLSRQNFPTSAQYPPYDDIAWTLGGLYGVEVKSVDDTSVFRRPNLAALTDSVDATAAVSGSGGVYVIANRAQGEILPALYWLKAKSTGTKASALEQRVVTGKDTLPPGSVVLEGLDGAVAKEIATRYALPLTAMSTVPAGPKHALDLPRVAIYHTWFDTQNEGWARYTFEQYAIPYGSIDKDDLRRGKLRTRFDVILVPEVRGSLDQLIHEVDRKWGPMPFQKTAQTPSFGAPASSPDMTGGMGLEGLAELGRFVDDGGTLVTLGNSTRLPVESGIARALSTMAPRTLFHPGSIVRARTRRSESPILYGFQESFTIFRGNGPLFQLDPRDSTLLVLQYGTKLPERPKDEGPMLGILPPPPRGAAPTTPATPNAAAPKAEPTVSAAPAKPADEPYVVSGMVRGQDEIIGQGAIFDVPVKNGRVIAFTFDPLHRFLNHHEFPLVWNALMNWNDRPAAGTPPTVGAGGQ